MNLTAGTLVTALGLASVANAALVAPTKDLAPAPAVVSNDTSHLASLSNDEEERYNIKLKYGSNAPCQIAPVVLWTSVSVKSNLNEGAVPDIPKTCGALWDNLRRFFACAVIHHPTCGPHPTIKGVLIWTFYTHSICNHNIIGSAWWEATHNKFGDLKCVGVVRPSLFSMGREVELP
ncbi:hypothetical protein LX36DRAFT_709600 [Colletotrichum falcatum]|nr:hypothetical protein LX36DRAFT_709600 [Colletotrichum falcatum]